MLWVLKRTVSMRQFFEHPKQMMRKYSQFFQSGPIQYLPREMYLEGYIVEEIWEGYSVFCSHRLTNDNLVDIIKFIPIFISAKMKHRQIIMIHCVQSI